MRVTMIARPACEGGNCPTSYATDRRSVLVQGYKAAPSGSGLPTVTVPEALLVAHEQAGGAAWPASAYTGTGTGILTVTAPAVSDLEALAYIAPAENEDVLELCLAVAE